MKTTFRQFLKETSLPKATSPIELIASIKNGKFTLDGSDIIINSAFTCDATTLVSLVGSPRKISGSFSCTDNDLETLEGGPMYVGNNYSCSRNSLNSLSGAPREIVGGFYCSGNVLTSLEGVPERSAGLYFFKNKLTSLNGIHKHVIEIDGNADFSGNPIKSHVLGLLKIKGLRNVEIDNKEVEKIINQYLPEGDLFTCQEKLIDAGFEEFAKL